MLPQPHQYSPCGQVTQPTPPSIATGPASTGVAQPQPSFGWSVSQVPQQLVCPVGQGTQTTPDGMQVPSQGTWPGGQDGPPSSGAGQAHAIPLFSGRHWPQQSYSPGGQTEHACPGAMQWPLQLVSPVGQGVPASIGQTAGQAMVQPPLPMHWPQQQGSSPGGQATPASLPPEPPASALPASPVVTPPSAGQMAGHAIVQAPRGRH